MSEYVERFYFGTGHGNCLQGAYGPYATYVEALNAAKAHGWPRFVIDKAYEQPE